MSSKDNVFSLSIPLLHFYFGTRVADVLMGEFSVHKSETRYRLHYFATLYTLILLHVL